jgi:hypothetical protein
MIRHDTNSTTWTLTELAEAEKQVKEETRELLVSLDEKQKELTEYHTNIVKIKRYIFLAVRQIYIYHRKKENLT